MTGGATGRSKVADETGVRSGRRELVGQVARSGQTAMSIGLLAFGVASYVFLAVSGRALGPSRFALVSVLWAVLYLVGGGLFIPLEQELGRSVAARQVRGVGSGALARRAGAVGLVTFAVVAVVLLVLRQPVSDLLFRGDSTFVDVLVFGIGGVGAMFFVRGLLAGSDRYFGFSLLFFADAATKCVPTIALALAGVTNPVAYGLVLAVSSFAGSIVPMSRRTGIGDAGPSPAWSLLLSSLGFLLLTSFLTSVTVNIGTIAVEVLATPAQSDEAGIFLSGLVIARIPLFLFQAVQAIMLPRLSRLAASGEMNEFRRTVRRLGIGMAAATIVGTLGSALVGPLLVKILFGPNFALLGSRDMALLTLASTLTMCGMAISQAQIALHHQRQTGWAWAAATLSFLAVTAVAGPDLFQRVEFGMVAAGITATVVGAWLLRNELRHPDEHREETPAL